MSHIMTSFVQNIYPPPHFRHFVLRLRNR